MGARGIKFVIFPPFYWRADFPKAADTRTHVFAKFDFWTQNCKNYLFLPDFTDFNAFFLCFLAFPAKFCAQFFLVEHFVCAMKICAMKIAFRKSVVELHPLLPLLQCSAVTAISAQWWHTCTLKMGQCLLNF